MSDEQPKSEAEIVVAVFGGVSDTARAIGAPITTVHAWTRSGRIPHWRKAQIAAVAERLGKRLPDGFLPPQQAAQ